MSASIFIISSDTPFADGLAERLRDLGFSIDGVAAGLRPDATPDAVILDLAAGADARQAIADLRAVLPAPLVVLTGAPFAEVPTGPGAAVGYMRKPFEDAELKLAVEVELFRAGVLSAPPPIAPAPVPKVEPAAPVIRGDKAILGLLAVDLRYPMGSVLGYSRFVQNRFREEIPGPALRFLQAIDKSAGMMLAQVDAFVDLETLASCEPTMTKAATDLKALVRDIAELHREVGEEKEVNIALDLTPFPSMISADLPKMSQVVTILITNAIQGCPPKTNVVISMRYRGDEIEVAVKDHGPGVPLDEQGNLFSPPGRKPPGPAMVLAIARKIVEAHDGRIGVESSEGDGATFWFTVPMIASKVN